MEVYLAAILIQVGIYLLLTLGLNLHFGFTGLGNLGHVAFYCLGAYTSGLLVENGAALIPGAIAGMAVAAATSLVMGALSLRLRAEFLAILTLGFAEVVRLIVLNESWLTNGSAGHPVYQPFAGVVTAGQRELIYLVLVFLVVALAVAVVSRLVHSPFGRLMRAIRDSQESVQAIGKTPVVTKLKSLMIGAAFAGLAGALQAHYIGYISPDQFSSEVTFLCWMAMLIGGTGRIGGSVIGAFVLLGIHEGSRFLNLVLPFVNDVQVAYIRMGVIGLLLILFARYRPAGILAERGR